MKQISLHLVLFTIILVLLLTGCTQMDPSTLVVKPEAATRIDKLLTQMTRDGTFTGSVLVAQNGKVYLSQGYGLADRLQGTPNTPQTRFHLGSMTKQFTAMAILILESQGKLSVDDSVCSYIDECPAAWQDITIHHLLTHTSGLSGEQSEKLYQLDENAAHDPTIPTEPAYYLDLARELQLDIRPGEQFVYSNFGYVLLGHIIERVSNQSYASFLEQAIFTPLNMRNTGLDDALSGEALVYSDRDDTQGGLFLPLPLTDSASGLYSTTGDLLLWDQALYTDQLLPQAGLERIFTRYVRDTPDAPGFGYGYGWLVGQILGQPLLGGAGGGPTFSTLYVRYPQDRLTLIVLTNQGGINHFSILGAIVINLFAYNLLFGFTAVAFNLLLSVLFVAQRNAWARTTRVIGVVWFLLIVPFVIIFIRHLGNGMGWEIMLPFTLILLFMLVEFLLDIVFKRQFRSIRTKHVLYLVLEYSALFSLIWIAFNVSQTLGYLVLITFFVLQASMIYFYREKIRIR